MLCEMGAAAPGCTCLTPQHCLWGSETPSLVNPHGMHGVEISRGSATALVLLTKEENPMEGC